MCVCVLQLVYHGLQLVAFAVLAVLIMRLKLFLTPHMCIMASLICSRQVRPPPTVTAIGNNTTSVTCLCSQCVCSHVPSLNNVCRQLFGWIGEKLKHQAAVIVIMALMAVQGVANLQAQWAIIGEFSNLPQEELLDWIQENTQPGGWRRLTGEENERSSWFIHSPCVRVPVCRFSVCGGDAHHGQCEALHRTSHRQSPPL